MTGKSDGSTSFQGAVINKSNRHIQALGEVSIWVKDLGATDTFYEQMVGLEVLWREESFVFYKIAEGYQDHPQILAIFNASSRSFLEPRSLQINPDQSTLHHIALNIALQYFEPENNRLEGLELKVVTAVHEWIHVRSLYFPDPEWNLVEFVAHDESVG